MYVSVIGRFGVEGMAGFRLVGFVFSGKDEMRLVVEGGRRCWVFEERIIIVVLESGKVNLSRKCVFVG